MLPLQKLRTKTVEKPPKPNPSALTTTKRTYLPDELRKDAVTAYVTLKANGIAQPWGDITNNLNHHYNLSVNKQQVKNQCRAMLVWDSPTSCLFVFLTNTTHYIELIK